MSSPGFAFPYGLDEALAPLLEQLPDQGQGVVDALQERDVLLEDALTFVPPYQVDNPAFTATSGGATITFPRGFDHVPVVVICAGDDVGTPPVTYQQVLSMATPTSFTVKVYSGVLEATSGTYRIAYFAS